MTGKYNRLSEYQAYGNEKEKPDNHICGFNGSNPHIGLITTFDALLSPAIT